MGLRYQRGPTGPNCYESPDVQLIDGRIRDIPFEGSLIAVLVPTDSGRECNLLGLIFDDRATLIVDCLHADDEVRAFRDTCAENRIERIAELSAPILAPCPPPTNQIQISDWAAKLFSNVRPT
jgi:hypothetical protein